MSTLATAKSWLADLFVHHHAENLRTLRAVNQKAHGVAVPEYPYPGAVQSSNNPTTTINQGKGWLLGSLLGASLLAAGGAGALALPGLLGQRPVAPAPPVASGVESPAASKPAPGMAYDAIYEEQQPDGTWRTIKREHLKSP